MESRIDRLLRKYWNGESTLDEEKELKQYFQAKSGSEPYFDQIVQAREVQNKVGFKYPVRNVRKWYALAASVALLISVSLFFLKEEHANEYIVDDPKEAYEVTRKALLMISDGLNEGTQYTAEIKRLNKAQEFIQE
ncbi:MAG: hypothetical protein RIA69_17800 [Cyclobacteriaceae bacterium]